MFGFFKKRGREAGSRIMVDEAEAQRLHEAAQRQKRDLYTFLCEESSLRDAEERLAYMNSIIASHPQSYELEENDELRREGLIIEIYYPTGSEEAESGEDR